MLKQKIYFLIELINVIIVTGSVLMKQIVFSFELGFFIAI